MKIEIRHLYKTCLKEEAFLKLVKKYSSTLKKDVLIVFDLRVKDYGQYIFDKQKKIHTIKISPETCGFTSKKVKLDEAAEKYNLISTVIHELYHARQREKLGQEFWSLNYREGKGIIHSDTSDFYSICEIEARTFENENLLEAVEFYDSCCK